MLAVALFQVQVPVAASPDEVTLQPSEADSHVEEIDPDQNFWDDVIMWVTSKEANQDIRSFVRFDLSGIPTGATVHSATLSLRMKDAPSASRTLEAQRVSDGWSESTITWNNQPGVSGTPVSTTTGTTGEVWLTWDVTTDVQDFIQYQTATNHGWRIKDQTEGSATEHKESFYTRDETSETTLRPKLGVSYSTSPTVDTVGIYETDHATLVTAMDPQTELAVRVTVTDAGTLADLTTVRVTIFHDSDGDDDAGDAPGSGDTQNAAILTCTVGATPSWQIDPGSNTTWQLVEANSVQPALTNTTGDFWFHFVPGKVATQAADWDVYAVADDGGGTPGNLYDGSDYDMNWYGEITINTASVDWGSVDVGSTFSDNPLTAISVTYTSNGDYQQQARAASPWTSAGGASATLSGTDNPGAGEFSLKANVTDTLTTAVPIPTSYTTVATGTQTSEEGYLVDTNSLWLRLGPSGIPAATYSGTIYYGISP
jgi:hypothetical protein